MKQATPPTTTRREAVKQGFRPLTSAYWKHEQDMLKRALRDLRGCKVVLVEMGEGVEIWRSASELKSSS